MFARMANAAGQGICSKFGPAYNGPTGWRPVDFDISKHPKIPDTVNGFIAWLLSNEKRLRQNKMYYTEDQVDAILREGLDYGLEFVLHGPHTKNNNPWTHPHFNITNTKSANPHIPVPPGYSY